MKKIYILGSVASGKTTLAKKLSQKFDINYYELDSIIFDDTKIINKRRTQEEQLAIITTINTQQTWIIEGTYRKTCHIVLDLADTIIWLDPPLFLRKIRILTRFIKQKLHIEKCNYKSNYSMLKKMYQWTNDFESKRDKLNNILKFNEKKLVILKNNNDVKKFIKIGCKKKS